MKRIRMYPGTALDRPALLVERVGIGHYRVIYVSADSHMPVSVIVSSDMFINDWDCPSKGGL